MKEYKTKHGGYKIETTELSDGAVDVHVGKQNFLKTTWAKYYHGIPYNGVTLNCAIHPQGSFGEQCPDWQGFQESIQLYPTERIVNILFQPDEDEPTGHVTIFRCLGDWHEEELTKPCEFATSVVSIASPLACPITSDLKMDKYCEKSGFIRTSIGMKKKDI